MMVPYWPLFSKNQLAQISIFTLTSHHSQSHKQSVVRTLFSRAELLSSYPSLKSIEELHVSQALQDNGYPERFIHSSCLPRPCPTSPSETEGLTTFTLPYLKGPSEAIQRVLQPLNIRTFFRLTRTLRQILCHPKDPVPAHQQARSCLQDSLFWLFQVVRWADRKNSCTTCEETLKSCLHIWCKQ